MKRKLLSVVLSLAMVMPAAVSASAIESFPEISQARVPISKSEIDIVYNYGNYEYKLSNSGMVIFQIIAAMILNSKFLIR